MSSPRISMTGFTRPRPARFSGQGAQRGFSLIEMLFVVAIIGLIAALAIPQFAKAFGKSRIDTTRANIALLSSAVESFSLNCNRYPTEAEGLQALIKKPDNNAEGWAGSYLGKKTLPKDGWGREFIYKLDKEFPFVIKSLGADGKEGGTGDDADIDNRS